MKLKPIFLSILLTIPIYSQTTVQFSATHQFFDASKDVLEITILVNETDTYNSGDPIMITLFSDLKDSLPLGITATRGLDRVILPENYTDKEQIQFPINIKALEGIEKFTLFLQKKGENEQFKISQNSHVVMINKAIVHQSYVGISSITNKGISADFEDKEELEIPFNVEAKGYLPVEVDQAVISVNIKDVEESNGLYTFAMAGATSAHKVVVDKNKNPEVHEKIISLLREKQQLELEISDITHQSPNQITIDSLKQSAYIHIEKVNRVDARYSIHLGTNFEFATSFKAKDIYYEIDVSLLNLFKSRWGLRVGMYKNSNSRYLEDFMLRPYHYELVDETAGGQVYNLIQTGMAPGVTTESLGFFFETPYKLIESNHFNVFISPHFELIERRETYTYQIIYTSVFETKISSYPLDFSVPRPLPKPVSSKYWEGYLGLSFPMLYRNIGADFEVTINPIIGAGYPGPYAIFAPFYTGIQDYDYIQIVENNSGLRFFSAFQFNIIINPKNAFGIKVGSDVRKYFGAERKPIVNINLSTKIEFSEIFDLARKQ